MPPSLGELLTDVDPSRRTGGPAPGRPIIEQTAAEPEGTVETRSRVLSSFSAEPSQRWRDSTALLRVERDGDGFFRVLGTNSEIELPWVSGPRYGHPDLALGSLTDGEEGTAVDPRDIYDLMPEWSRTHDEICDWINALRGRFGDENLRLIIWDDTGFEIPWELVWLEPEPASGLRRGWLGALVTVARWITIHKVGRNPYNDQPEECAGDVLVYLDEAMRHDFEALRRFSDQPYYSVSDFLGRLRTGDSQLSLVYMACHGRHGRESTRLELGGLHLRDLHVPLTTVSRSRSLIFLNACHSARLIQDSRMADGLLRGFAESFLRQGAAAIIGTAGRIGTDSARQAAQSIIEELARNRDRPVAAVLRDMRAQAARDAPVNPDDPRGLLTFMYRFMYLYFGNPCTTLRLEDRSP
jgi:hypothetical protein